MRDARCGDPKFCAHDETRHERLICFSLDERDTQILGSKSEFEMKMCILADRNTYEKEKIYIYIK